MIKLLKLGIAQVDFSLQKVIVNIHFFEVIEDLEFPEQVDFHHFYLAILLLKLYLFCMTMMRSFSVIISKQLFTQKVIELILYHFKQVGWFVKRLGEFCHNSVFILLIWKDLVLFLGYFVVGLWNFEQFLLHVAILFALVNNEVNALLLLYLWNLLKNISEGNKFYVTVASRDSENDFLEHYLLPFIDDSVVHSKYALVFVNLAEIFFIAARAHCKIREIVLDLVSLCIPNTF